MSQRTIDERLERVEQRLIRVERWLGLAVDDAPAPPAAAAGERPELPPVAVPPLAGEAVIEIPVARPMSVEAIDPPIAEVPPPAMPTAAPVPLTNEPTTTAVAVAAALTSRRGVPVAYAQPERPTPVRQTTFERTVGLKWAGWAGAIVMAIGAALGLRFAYEQGMFGIVPASVRLLMLYLGGFALLAAGEVVYRRVNKLSAVGLLAAGVATLFVVSYAGHDYFGLYPRQMALGLMAASTLVGAAVAMRGGFVSIAVLSILGGHVAPIVLGSGKVDALPLLAYLAALQVVALLLAAWGRQPKWWTLRALSLVTTGLWMTPAILTHLGTPGQMLAFSILYAGLFQLELIYSNWRAKGEVIGARANTGIAFSTVVTAALAVAGLAILSDASDAAGVTWMLSLALGAMALRFATSRGRGAALAALGLAYAVQAASLVVAAAPVALGGIALSLAWAVLALAFGGVAVVTGSRIARLFSPGVWVLAVGYLAAWALNESTLATRMVLGQTVPDVGLMAAGLAITGYLVARLLLVRLTADEEAGFTAAARALTGVATLTFVVAAVASLAGLAATIALVAFAWGLVLIEPLLRRLQLSVNGLAVLAVAIVKWAGVDVLAGNLLVAAGRAPAYDPIFNPMMGTGLLLAASLASVAWWRRGPIADALRSWGADDARGQLLHATVLAVVGLLTLGLSVEISRTIDQAVAGGATFHRPPAQLKMLGLTALWATATLVCRLVITLAHRAQRQVAPALPLLAGLMVALAMKYVAIDTLGFRLGGDGSDARVARLLNAELLTATLLIGALLAMRWLARPAARVSAVMLLGTAGVVLTWAGTMHLDAYVAVHGGGAWQAWHLRQMLWTTWWSLCAAGLAFALRRNLQDDPRALARLPIYLSIGATALATKCLLVDVLLPYALFRTAPVLPVANVQGVAVASVLGLLALATFTAARQHGASRGVRLVPLLMAALLALLWGTTEIGRLFAGPFGAAFTSPGRARGVAVSIYWAAFAIASVAAGFQWRTAALRYVGLGLFAVTLGKVFFVDLSEVGTGYRILSFFGLGMLLLGTSVLYGKLGPKLLEGEEEPSNG